MTHRLRVIENYIIFTIIHVRKAYLRVMSSLTSKFISGVMDPSLKVGHVIYKFIFKQIIGAFSIRIQFKLTECQIIPKIEMVRTKSGCNTLI